MGVSKVDRRGFDGCLGLLDRCFGRRDGLAVAFDLRFSALKGCLGHVRTCDRIVTIRGGDGLGLEEVLHPLAVDLRQVQCRLLPPYTGLARLDGGAVPVRGPLGHVKIRLGIGQRSLEGRRVDLVEHLAGLYDGPFGEEALLDNAIHLRPDLRDEIGACASRQARYSAQHAGVGPSQSVLPAVGAAGAVRSPAGHCSPPAAGAPTTPVRYVSSKSVDS